MKLEEVQHATHGLCTGLVSVPENEAVPQLASSPRRAAGDHISGTAADDLSAPTGSGSGLMSDPSGQHAQRPHQASSQHQGRKQHGASNRDRHSGGPTRPHTKKGQWSEDEEMTLAKHHREVGNKWAAISKFLPQRSDNDVKNHWNSTLRSKSTQKHSTFLWLYAKEVEQVAEDEAARYRCFDSAHRTYEMLRDSQGNGAEPLVVNTKPARRGVTSWPGHHKLAAHSVPSTPVSTNPTFPSLGGGGADLETEGSQCLSAEQAAIPPVCLTSQRRSSEHAICQDREQALAQACAHGIVLHDREEACEAQAPQQAGRSTAQFMFNTSDYAGVQLPGSPPDYPWLSHKLPNVMASLDLPDGMSLDEAIAMDLAEQPLEEVELSSFLGPYTLPHDLQGHCGVAHTAVPSMTGMVPCSSLNSMLTTDSDLLVSGPGLNALGGGAGSVLLSNMDQSGSETMYVRPLHTPSLQDFNQLSHSLSSDNFTGGAPQSASHPQATPSANNNNNRSFGSADSLAPGGTASCMDPLHGITDHLLVHVEPHARKHQQQHQQQHHHPISTPRINNDVGGFSGEQHRLQPAAACDTGRGSNSPEKTGPMHMDVPSPGGGGGRACHPHSDLHAAYSLDTEAGMFTFSRLHPGYEQHSSQQHVNLEGRRMSLPLGLGSSGQWAGGGVALPEIGLEVSHAELDTEANSANDSNVDRQESPCHMTSAGSLGAFHTGGAGATSAATHHGWGMSTKRGHVELEGQAWKVDGGSWCASVQPGRGASIDIARWDGPAGTADWAGRESYLMPRASAPLPDCAPEDEPPATRQHTSRPTRRPCTKVVSSMSLGSHTGGAMAITANTGSRAVGPVVDAGLMGVGHTDMSVPAGGLSDGSGTAGNSMHQSGGSSGASVPPAPAPRIIIHKLPTTSKWNTAVAAARGWPTAATSKRNQRNQQGQQGQGHHYRAARSQPGILSGLDPRLL